MDGSNNTSGGLSSRSLPSLFSISNGSSMASKDLEGLMAMNDSALSQQIEFILQDAPMEHDDDDVDGDDDDDDEHSSRSQQQHHHHQHNQQVLYQHQVITAKAGSGNELAHQLMDTETSNSQGAISTSAAAAGKTLTSVVFKLETPPNSTTPITSASDISQTSQDGDQQSIIEHNTTTSNTSTQSHIQQSLQQRRQHHHFLNGRGIIVRSSDLHEYTSNLPLSAANAMDHHSIETEEDEDPELNDENLQDIEEEAKAAEADEEPPHLEATQIKVENMEVQTNDNTPRLAYTSTATTVTTTDADGQPTQLVLPAGSIVSTGTRTVTVPVSEALAHLQRRPVFISNGVANVGGTTLVRMPAVLSRNGSMAVLNVVQQQVGSNGQTTQLILQAAPMGNGSNTAGTPIMVTTSPQTAQQQHQQQSSADNTGNSSPLATITPTSNNQQILNNALTTNQPPQQQTTTIMSLNTNSAACSSPTQTSGSNITNAAISTTNATATRSPPLRSLSVASNTTAAQHPIASTSAQAQAANFARNTSSTSPPSSNASSSSPSSSTTATAAGGGGGGGVVGNANPIYQCMECVEKFDNKELYEIHRSGHANNMKCAICNMVLKSLKNYEKHCLRCKPYECQICGRVVRFRPNFIKHMRVHTGQQSERHKYKCEVCHKEFMSFEYFKVHKKIHNENVNLTCEICGKQFSALASLRGHSKLHSGVKLHKCEVCGKGFGQRYNLKIHARTHTGDFPFECKICKKKLHTQSSLQTHMQVHQRVQTSQATSTIKSTATSTTTSGNTSSSSSSSSSASSAHNSPTSTIIKMEPQLTSSSIATSPLERPSTSSNVLLSQHTMHDDLDENSGMSDGLNSLNGHQYVTTSVKNTIVSATGDDSSESSNTSQEQLRQTRQILLNGATPTRAIVINNYLHNNDNKGVDTLLSQTSQPQHHAQVIRQNSSSTSTSSHITSSSSSSGSNSALQQQLMRKTPIIHSTGGVATLSNSVFASAVQHRGTSPSPSPSSSSTSCSSSVVVSKSGVPLSLASAALGSSSIIRSTRDHDASLNGHHHQHHSQHNHNNHQRNNHRNHHRRRHLADMDDDDDDTNLHHPSVNNGRHFDDDDDILDEKSSPSLATTAIKTEPNFYVSGDNSNEMLIKEEVVFDDASANSPHSPPSSKFGMSNFDNDLDHHVDLAHSLPTYGYLLDQHSIPDTIPAQLYADDDDFRLDHNSLGALHNNSSSTADGDYIKKEWSYGTSSNYTINGKFDDDSNALCDAANFIYN